MKYTKSLLVIAAAASVFAVSCQQQGPAGPSEAQIDSLVNAKVQATTDQLKADCDAKIMQAAQMRADSILAATSKTPGAVKPATKPTATKPKPATPAKKDEPTTSKTKWDQNKETDKPTSKSKFEQNQEKKGETTSKSKWDK